VNTANPKDHQETIAGHSEMIAGHGEVNTVQVKADAHAR
jgi:hypothetical protein